MSYLNNNTILGSLKAVSINSALSDNAIPISAAKYIVRKFVVTNPSGTLAISPATLGLFTATGGGGTTVVTAAVLTALTGSTKYIDMTIALTTDVLTNATLYARNVIANGSAATVDIYVIGDVLG